MLRARENLKPSARPTISTEAAKRGIEMDRTKTVIGTGSQRATAQPDVKFATKMPSMSFMAVQSWLPPTNEGIQSRAFQVPQLVNTQKQYLQVKGQKERQIQGTTISSDLACQN